MTNTDVTEGRQGQALNEGLEEPVLNDFSDFRERLRQVLKQDAPENVAPSGRRERKGAIMPKIKGLEILKEGGYAVDLEKTIHDMFVVIKNMEAQLERVLSINALLEKDLNDSKEMIAELRASKTQLEKQVARMEREMPSKRELQMEIDHLIEERNSAQITIRDLKSRLEKTKKTLIQSQKRMARLHEERKDAITEIDFVETRLEAAVEKIKDYESRINVLEGTKLAQAQKIKALDEELKETLDEKYGLIKELKETREGMNEIRSALADTKLQAKRSFYKGVTEDN
jgi:chromosome segregation ATPase